MNIIWTDEKHYCQCGCGREVRTSKHSFINGHTWKRRSSPMKGKHYSCPLSTKINISLSKGGTGVIKEKVSVLCQCGCGNMTKSGCIYLHGHNRRNKETTKETKILLSKQKLGDKNPAKNPEIKVKIAKKVELLWKTNEYRDNHSNWLGGISKFPYTQDWTDTLKESIRQRDNYKCQLCLISQDELNIKLHVHHKDYDKENCDPNNLISLCHSCHTKTNHNREHWKKFFNQTNIRLIL